MSLLTASIVGNNYILARIYFIFLENVIDQALKAFNTKLVKRLEKQLSLKKNFALLCKLVALSLGENCLKGLRVTKMSKKKKKSLRRPWGVRGKITFTGTILVKVFQTSSSFWVK